MLYSYDASCSEGSGNAIKLSQLLLGWYIEVIFRHRQVAFEALCYVKQLSLDAEVRQLGLGRITLSEVSQE